jgi:L-lactate utilization protein LutB
MAAISADTEFSTLASEERIGATVRALEANGMHAIVVENGDEARETALGLIPEGTEVFTATSRTLESIGLASEINESPRYKAVRPRMYALDRATQQHEIRKLSAAPEVVVGSVHAITEQGQVMTASYGGSQLMSYAAGADSVIWVVGTQKLVRTLDDGMRRIREYSLPREDARLREAIGRSSAVGKVLIVFQEPVPGRITVILVKQNLGF